MSQRPHDALFKSAFAQSENAAGLLRQILPASLSAAIDWSTLARQPGSFIDDDLHDSHSDLLFSVELAGHPAVIYVLFEHQSTVEPDMLLRVLAYVVRGCQQVRKESNHRAPVPPIIPVLLCNAPGGWTAAQSFHELVQPHPSTVPGLAELVPSFRMVVVPR